MSIIYRQVSTYIELALANVHFLVERSFFSPGIKSPLHQRTNLLELPKYVFAALGFNKPAVFLSSMTCSYSFNLFSSSLNILLLSFFDRTLFYGLNLKYP